METLIALGRRQALLVAVGALVAGIPAQLSAASLLPELAADDGSPIRNFAAPDEQRILTLPALLSVGRDDADVAIIEFFDYNCGYCREAGSGLDQVLDADRRARLVLVHNPILSDASARAAHAVAAVQRAYGGATAYEIHKQLLGTQGHVNDRSVFESARLRGLNLGRIENAMASPSLVADLHAQRQFAAASGFRVTPTFVMAGIGFIGWPGAPTMIRFSAAARRCRSLRCSNG